jgi:hypothetical protein
MHFMSALLCRLGRTPGRCPLSGAGAFAQRALPSRRTHPCPAAQGQFECDGRRRRLNERHPPRAFPAAERRTATASRVRQETEHRKKR